MNKKVIDIIKDFESKSQKINFSIKAISGSNQFSLSYNGADFMYAASLSKVFIAAEFFRRIEEDSLTGNEKILLKEKNIVGDARSLNSREEEVDFSKPITLFMLVELMLKESNNSAANELIDYLDRAEINNKTILKNGWSGCEIKRKYLSRDKEEKEYKNAPIMKVSTDNMVDFFSKLHKEKLFGSKTTKLFIKSLCDDDLHYNKTLRIQRFKTYYNKYGSVRTNLFSYGVWSAIKGLLQLKRLKPEVWLHDSGIVEIDDTIFAVSIMSYGKVYNKDVLNLKSLSEKIFKTICPKKE